MAQYDYLVVGAGLYGAVFAQQAKAAGKRVLVVGIIQKGKFVPFCKEVVPEESCIPVGKQVWGVGESHFVVHTLLLGVAGPGFFVVSCIEVVECPSYGEPF